MSDGYLGIATAGIEALAAIAKEIPAIKNLFTSKDDRIREVARNLQEEIVGYCNHLEECVKQARDAVGNDVQLLNFPLSQVDAKWQEKAGMLKRLFQNPPSGKIKSIVHELDGFGDRLSALLSCRDSVRELVSRAEMEGKYLVAYSALLASDPPIGKILERIERDTQNMRKDVATLGTL